VLRWVPPAHSPVRLASVAAAAAGYRFGEDPRLRLERILRRAYDAQCAVLTGSGTQALELAIRAAWQLRPGSDTVALPSFGCYDLASAAVGAGAGIALYDLDPGSLGPDLASLEACLAGGVRVAVIAPLYGIPVDWETLEALADRYGALLIEDAAQGHGASWRHRPLGSLGRLSVLSFGRGKGWTGGGGGALLLRGEGMMAQVQVTRPGSSASPLAAAAAQALLSRPYLYALPRSLPALALGETRYHPPAPIRCMGAGPAALVLASRSEAAIEGAARRSAAERIRDALGGEYEGRLPVPPVESRPGFLRFPILLPDGLRSLSHPGRGLRLGAAAAYPSTLADLPQVRERLEGGPSEWPGARRLVRELVTLPTHGRVREGDERALLRLVPPRPPARSPLDAN
jgi:perosamine synthetase